MRRVSSQILIKMTLTDKELNDAEEAVTKFAEATGLSEKEVVEGLQMDWQCFTKVNYLIGYMTL